MKSDIEKFLKDMEKTNFLVQDNKLFINRNTKINFICKNCNKIISATPHNIIINRMGCPNCGKKHRWNFNEVKTYIDNFNNKEYILLSNETELAGKSGKINTNKFAKILHKKCNNIFSRKITRFINENLLCPECYKKPVKKLKNEIQEKLDKIYFKRFTIEGNYNGRHKEISLKCNICGNISTDLCSNFLTNLRGCSYCSSSKSEQLIISFFKKNNITIKRNVKFEGLIDKKKLSYDFIFKNLLIEIDGEQHFNEIPNFKRSLLEQINHDKIKNNYALENSKTLIRMSVNTFLKYYESLLNYILLNSETIENFNFSDIDDVLIIKNKKIIKQFGKYNKIEVL